MPPKCPLPPRHGLQAAWVRTPDRDPSSPAPWSTMRDWLVEKLAPHLPGVRHFVLMTDRAHMPASTTIPALLCYEELVEAENGDWAWPEFDENEAACICYTSGTTGHPKGAVYSHRSTVLHALASALPDAMASSSADTILPVVPMFHVNAWGLPYSAPLVGARLVFPGPHLDGKSLHALFESERVTFSAGVPTIWLGVINHMKQNGLRLSTLRRTVIGGSACPPAMMRTRTSPSLRLSCGMVSLVMP